VSLRRRLAIGALGLFAALPAAAQQFAVGATYGWWNDIEGQFKLQNFHSPDWEGWVQTQLGDDVVVRAGYGWMRVTADNAGDTLTINGTPVTMPEYREKIQYLTVSVSYLLSQGPITSGLFGGVGGYGIRPDEVSPALDPYRDQRERVFGWHAGVEGDVRVYRGVSVMMRTTIHGILSTSNRTLLTASVGALYRF